MKFSSALNAFPSTLRSGPSGQPLSVIVASANFRVLVASHGAAKSHPGRRQRFGGAVGAAHRLPCGARPCGPSHNSLRSLAFATLRQGATRQLTWRACARGPQALALQAAPGQQARPLARHKRSLGPFVPGLASSAPRRRAATHPGAPLQVRRWIANAHHRSWTSRQTMPGRGDLWGGEEHRAGVGARSALRGLTRRGCPSAVSAANVASCAARPQAEHRSEVGAKRRPLQHEPLPGAACRNALNLRTVWKCH